MQAFLSNGPMAGWVIPIYGGFRFEAGNIMVSSDGVGGNNEHQLSSYEVEYKPTDETTALGQIIYEVV